MQGAQNVRSEAYLQVRRNDEGEAQPALGGQMDFLLCHQSLFFHLQDNRVALAVPAANSGRSQSPS